MGDAKRLKIAILSHSSELGGAERSMIDLLDNWVETKDIEVHMIIRKPLSNMVPELKKRGWKYYPVYYTNWSQRNPSTRAEDVYRNARYNAQAVAEIENRLTKIKPDLVMTNTLVAPWAAIAAYFLRLPHIWFVREYGDIDHRHIFELGREKMLEDINTLSDMIVVNSQTLGKHIAEYVEVDKVTPLYTPFDIEKLERKAEEQGNSPFKDISSLKLVITGRVAPSKGQEEAARAVGILNQQGFNTELCVIGTPSQPEDQESLNAVITEMGIADKIHLIGNQPNPLKYIRQADVGIMASQQEAFGRVTCEYMMLSKPVVGANSGATPEIIDEGSNGFLYEKGNLDSLVEKLLIYAKDENLRQAHGQHAKQKIETMMKGKFNAEHLYQKIEDMLNSKSYETRKPLNFARKWLDYPLIAQQYIEDSKTMSFTKIVRRRIRARAKWAYLKVTGLVQKDED